MTSRCADCVSALDAICNVLTACLMPCPSSCPPWLNYPITPVEKRWLCRERYFGIGACRKHHRSLSNTMLAWCRLRIIAFISLLTGLPSAVK